MLFGVQSKKYHCCGSIIGKGAMSGLRMVNNLLRKSSDKKAGRAKLHCFMLSLLM